jgi:hypothetical protein
LTDGPFGFHLPDDIDERQRWSDEDDDVREHEYEGVICPALTRLHFLNRKNGKPLGQGDE